MPSVVLWNNIVAPFWVTCTGGWLLVGGCCCCCAFIIVILEGKKIIAIANTTADVNPIVVDGETNDREGILMMERTNEVQVLQQNKGNVLTFFKKSPQLDNFKVNDH